MGGGELTSASDVGELGAVEVGQDAAAQAQPGMLRQLNSVQPDFVVQSVAHLRSFRGKAYLPALVPDGVAVEMLP